MKSEYVNISTIKLQAGNGIEALDKIEKERPDIIVSDIMMPEMDGFMLPVVSKMEEN